VIETEKSSLNTRGIFVDLGGQWVRYDTVGTVKQVNGTEGPWCQVVLTIPGYKTIGVNAPADLLIATLESLRSRHEFAIGHERARGMR
jgi:hypothetical protein